MDNGASESIHEPTSSVGEGAAWPSFSETLWKIGRREFSTVSLLEQLTTAQRKRIHTWEIVNSRQAQTMETVMLEEQTVYVWRGVKEVLQKN